MAIKSSRFFEIDLLRGLAIIGMVTYHFLFDLSYFYNLPIGIDRGILFYLAKIVAIIFLLLVGMSLVFSYNFYKNPKLFIYINLKRSATILCFAMLITVVTYIVFPDSYIIFGILHLISISILISLPLLFTKNSIPIVISFFIILIGTALSTSLHSTNYLFIPFGVTPSFFSSFDYYPLFPWLGIIFVGLYVGRLYYPWRIKQKNVQIPQFFKSLSVNSLFIYLIHQPVILLILLIIKTILKQ